MDDLFGYLGVITLLVALVGSPRLAPSDSLILNIFLALVWPVYWFIVICRAASAWSVWRD